MIIYDSKIEGVELKEKWTVQDLEDLIEKVVIDPRRLIHESLQLESYIFSPI